MLPPTAGAWTQSLWALSARGYFGLTQQQAECCSRRCSCRTKPDWSWDLPDIVLEEVFRKQNHSNTKSPLYENDGKENDILATSIILLEWTRKSREPHRLILPKKPSSSSPMNSCVVRT
jgi:hypothetical protein